MDKSSTLPKNNNTYFYPSVTGSFIFSELFSPEVKNVIEFGKIRAGFAQVGNDTDPYQIITTYSQYTNIDSTTPGYRLPNTLKNDQLKPNTGRYARISSTTREMYYAAGGTADVGHSDDGQRSQAWLGEVGRLYREAWNSDRNFLIYAWAKANL